MLLGEWQSLQPPAVIKSRPRSIISSFVKEAFTRGSSSCLTFLFADSQDQISAEAESSAARIRFVLCILVWLFGKKNAFRKIQKIRQEMPLAPFLPAPVAIQFATAPSRQGCRKKQRPVVVPFVLSQQTSS